MLCHDEPVSDAGGPIRSVSAVTLATSDMSASTQFYEAIGFVRLYGGPDTEFTSYRAGTGFLNIQQDPAHAPNGRIWGRVIFWVADVDATYAQLTGAGYPTVTTPCDAPWGERYFHVHDPDGHELSFARPLDPERLV